MLNSEQVVLLKNYLKIADASDMELKGCLEVARRFKLDPFKQGQIWFIKRWDKNAASVSGTKGANVYTPQVGIYGMLHIAARDYKDFGSMSEAEYGPMFTHDVEGHKIKAPEWCRVKAYKKGIAQPTVATIYFEEFCPALWDNARLFWARMPRAQIEKCAKARALRTAYPDLGGLYIPEEMERMNEDITPEGREIIREAGASTGTHAAAQAVLDAKLAGRMPLHSTEAENASPSQVPASAKPEPWKFAGSITIDHTAPPPILTGDLEGLIVALPKEMNLIWDGSVSFYRVHPVDLDKLRQTCVAINYEVNEIRPAKSPAVPQRGATASRAGGKAESGTASPAVVSCTIERVNAGMAGKNPVRQVTVLLADRTKPTWSCFDKKWFEYLDAGLGKFARLVTKQNGKYTNIVGALQLGGREWLEDGTPVVQRDREAGGPTLF